MAGRAFAAGVAVVLACALTQAGAGAAALAAPTGGHNHGDNTGSGFGNGSHNKNTSFLIGSPSFSHDVAHVRAANIGGVNVTPVAQCKRTPRCRITQRVVVFDP